MCIDNQIDICTVGEFGQAVARHLSRFRPETLQVTHDVQERSQPWLVGRILVLAAWRPVPMICKTLDDFAHQSNLPFVPLIIENKMLSIGPVVLPGRGSCWSCWQSRAKQHDVWAQQRDAVMNFYAENTCCGPRGYLEPFALIGASMLSQIIDNINSKEQAPGLLWQIDMITREIFTSTIIGINDCPRCGLHRPADTRSIRELRAHLSTFWEQ